MTDFYVSVFYIKSSSSRLTYSHLFLKHSRLARLDSLGFDAPRFSYLASENDTQSFSSLATLQLS